MSEIGFVAYRANDTGAGLHESRTLSQIYGGGNTNVCLRDHRRKCPHDLSWRRPVIRPKGSATLMERPVSSAVWGLSGGCGRPDRAFNVTEPDRLAHSPPPAPDPAKRPDTVDNPLPTD